MTDVTRHPTYAEIVPARGRERADAISMDAGLPAGVSGPARRAFDAAGYVRLEQFRGQSRTELLAMHGVGPSVVRLLEAALAENGWTLREP